MSKKTAGDAPEAAAFDSEQLSQETVLLPAAEQAASVPEKFAVEEHAGHGSVIACPHRSGAGGSTIVAKVLDPAAADRLVGLANAAVIGGLGK